MFPLLKVRAWNPCACFKLFALKVTLWRNRNTAKELLVEISQCLPIFGDEVGMNVFSRKAHVLSLTSYSPYKAIFDFNGTGSSYRWVL